MAGLYSTLHGPNHVTIHNLNTSINDFIKNNAYKTVKFILKTRKWNVGIHPYTTRNDMDDSDLEDFEIKPKSYSTPSSVSGSLLRQSRRRALVPKEPSLLDDTTIVFITHPNLGRIQRLFLSTSKMEEVYNWVGSLSPNPDLFNLCTGVPDSYFPIDPNDGVLKFENRILTVMEKYNSDFTMDIVTGSNILTSTATALATSTVPKTPSPVKLPNKENPKGRCPVCSEFFDMVDLESHGSRCADNKFYVTVSSEEEVEEVLERNEIETLIPEKKTVPDILKELDVDRRNGLN